MVAGGSLALAGTWDSWLVRLALVLASVVPLVLLRAVTGLGVSRWATSTALAALLVLLAYLMTAGAGTGLLATLSDAVPRLLTEPTPYARRADLLAAPVLLTGLVSLLAGLRADGRTRVGPVAGAFVLYLAGALLSGGRSDPHGLLAVLLVVLALAGWVLLDRRAESQRDRLLTVLPVAGVAGVLLAAVAVVPADGAFQPREHVDPPLTEVEAASPLPRLGAWAANPDVELFRVRGPAVPLRLVALGTHDGSQWRAGTEYAPVGSTRRTSLPAGDERRRVDESVELTGLGGPWLPTPGDPVGVSGGVSDGVSGGGQPLVDLETGTLLETGAGEGTRYRVSAEVDAPDPQQLLAATVPTGAGTRPYLQQPTLPAGLTAYAARVVRDATTPYERAVAIEQAVQNQRALSSSATSGSAYWRIEQFLFGEPGQPGARVGTSEQFATAFALLARASGLPTRVVVGFRPGSPEPGATGADAETRVVRGADALAWPEVYFDRLGWVPFSPTPDDDTFDDGRPVVAPEPTTDGGDGPGPGDGASVAPSTASDPDDAAEAASTGSGGLGAGVLAGGAAVLLAALLGALALLRRWRTRRHLRRGDAGAWAEVLDALTLSGHPADRSLDATRIAAAADARWGTTAAHSLAERAERAVFGPAATPGSALTEDLRRVRRAARGGVPLWRRWWWWVDPRVLGKR
nr:transglutaminase domain-containing protein [Nocardioides flavescens]